MVEGAEGRYFVGKPELGNGADVLSLMRGMEDLALDLYTEPDYVSQGVEAISNTWVSLMEEMHQRLTHINDQGDVLAWMITVESSIVVAASTSSPSQARWSRSSPHLDPRACS